MPFKSDRESASSSTTRMLALSVMNSSSTRWSRKSAVHPVALASSRRSTFRREGVCPLDQFNGTPIQPDNRVRGLPAQLTRKREHHFSSNWLSRQGRTPTALLYAEPATAVDPRSELIVNRRSLGLTSARSKTFRYDGLFSGVPASNPSSVGLPTIAGHPD